MTLIRRLDCVLLDQRAHVREVFKKHLKKHPHAEAERRTLDELELPFANTSDIDLDALLGDGVRENLIAYLNGFTHDARDVFDHFRFVEQIERLSKAELLYDIVAEFAAIDLRPRSSTTT